MDVELEKKKKEQRPGKGRCSFQSRKSNPTYPGQ
jgi:hypothetical protein